MFSKKYGKISAGTNISEKGRINPLLRCDHLHMEDMSFIKAEITFI